mmetsp:Transcript_26165/g.73311  ORF Transcript_26165/g.73311 Transcript_26165/m.73311 type:complete len:230 (+) Transcript_26165:220-909(+)
MQQICHTSSNLKPIASARTPLCERPGTPTLPASHWSTSRGRLCVSRSHRDCSRIVTSATSAPASAAPIERRSFLPLIGETPQILADGNAFLKKRTEELGPVFRSHFALSECVIVTDSKLINQVLQAEHKTVIFDLLPSMRKLTESNLFGQKSGGQTNSKVAHRLDRSFLMEVSHSELHLSTSPCTGWPPVAFTSANFQCGTPLPLLPDKKYHPTIQRAWPLLPYTLCSP